MRSKYSSENAAKLASILIDKGTMKTNRPEKYKGLDFNPKTINIENALWYQPRYLAPLIVLLVKFPDFQNQFCNIPKDILETVEDLSQDKANGRDCRYEKYVSLKNLCSIPSK